MTVSSYDTEQILQLQNLTRERAEEMLTAITALRTAATNLTSSAWTGPAANAFQSAYDRWENQVKPLQECLNQLSAALGGAANALTTTETEIQRAFGG